MIYVLDADNQAIRLKLNDVRSQEFSHSQFHDGIDDIILVIL
jgi:hypothetical protein